MWNSVLQTELFVLENKCPNVIDEKVQHVYCKLST